MHPQQGRYYRNDYDHHRQMEYMRSGESQPMMRYRDARLLAVAEEGQPAQETGLHPSREQPQAEFEEEYQSGEDRAQKRHQQQLLQAYQQQQQMQQFDQEKRIPCNSWSLRDPEGFARLLLLPADVIQNVILQLANNNKQALVAHNIRVREIWIGYLPNDISEKILRTTFEIYGTVDNIEVFQKPNQTFAFLRYEKVAQASKAFENVEHLGSKLRAGLKISFSDYLKRNNIVGDCVKVEDVRIY